MGSLPLMSRTTGSTLYGVERQAPTDLSLFEHPSDEVPAENMVLSQSPSAERLNPPGRQWLRRTPELQTTF